MKRVLTFSLILLAAFNLFLNPVNAQYGCDYGQYGNGCTPSQSITINKLVGRVYTTKGGITEYEYVGNLSSSDPRFAPEQIVMFQIKVKNTSNIKLTNVTVKDYIPSYLEPIEGPGTYDVSTRIITFSAGDFDPNQEKVYYIKMKVLAQDKLPADKGLFCEINKAQAYNDNVSDEDTAQFCIEKQVVGVVRTPSAGPDMGLGLGILEMLGLGAGFLIRKKSNLTKKY